MFTFLMFSFDVHLSREFRFSKRDLRGLVLKTKGCCNQYTIGWSSFCGVAMTIHKINITCKHNKSEITQEFCITNKIQLFCFCEFRSFFYYSMIVLTNYDPVCVWVCLFFLKIFHSPIAVVSFVITFTLQHPVSYQSTFRTNVNFSSVARFITFIFKPKTTQQNLYISFNFFLLGYSRWGLVNFHGSLYRKSIRDLSFLWQKTLLSN